MSDIKESVNPALNPQADVLSDTTKDYNDTPMSSEGFGLSSDLASHVAQPSMTTPKNSFESAVSGFKFDGLRERSMEIVSTLETQAKANPLAAAAVIGFGALAAGYVLGRLLQPSGAAASVASRSSARHLDPQFNRAAQPEKFPAYTD